MWISKLGGSEKLKKVEDFLKELGIIVFEEDIDNQDYDLRDYIVDSLTFIDFIVKIEDYYQISLPMEALNYEILSSVNGFYNMIEDLIEKSKKK